MRRLMRSLIFGLLLAAAGSVTRLSAQSSTQQQEPLNCQKCEEEYIAQEGWFHNMTGVSCIIPEANCFDCTKDDGCHSIPYAGRCDINVDPNKGHHWCGTEEALIELRMLRRGGKLDEEAVFLRVAHKFPKSVRRSTAGYFVVTNCTGAVVAAFKQRQPLTLQAALVQRS